MSRKKPKPLKAKRETLTWEKHRPLLQRRHGVKTAEDVYVTASRNKVFWCGLIAVEMALEIMPNPNVSGLAMELYGMANDKERLRNFHDYVYEMAEGTYRARSNDWRIWSALWHATSDSHDYGYRFAEAVNHAARYAYPDYYATPKVLKDFRDAVEARCATRLAFADARTAKLEMNPPPLLEK